MDPRLHVKPRGLLSRTLGPVMVLVGCAASHHAETVHAAVGAPDVLPHSHEASNTTGVGDLHHLLVGPTAAEIEALRPLFLRGAAMVIRHVDEGADARVTLVVRAHAPIATVHRVVATPEEYAAFMPILRSVEVLSRHANRTGFRFHVAAPLFDVNALCAMTDLSERRIDVSVIESDTGPGGSRWDLVPDGPNDTILALTTWGDPSQGHWLLRQFARRSPASVAGMTVSVVTVLGLGVARRAEILAGSTAPARPPAGYVPPGELEAPTPGPWQALTHDAAVLSVSTTPEGAVRQVMTAGWTSASPAAVDARLRDVAHYDQVWPSMHDITVTPGASPDEVHFHVSVVSPLNQMQGDETLRVHGSTYFHEGTGGDFAGASQRWDVMADPAGGSVVTLTGGSDYNRAGWMTHTLMDRDPFLIVGFAGAWKVVWLRHLLHGL